MYGITDGGSATMSIGRRKDDDTPTPALIWQAVQQNHEQTEQGHGRLRTSIREAEARIDTVDKCVSRLEAAVSRLETKQVDASSLIFSTQAVVGIVVMVVGIVGGSYAVNYGARSDIRDILTRQNAKEELDRATVRVQEDRIKNMNDAIETLQRELRESVNQLRGEIRLKEYDRQQPARR